VVRATSADVEKNSLVIPIYGNQENIEKLLEALIELFERLEQNLEVVFVVDGSPDRSAAMLEEELPSLPFPAQLVQHSRNFGSFAAVVTGLSFCTGDYCAVMAADLQEPLELIEEFFLELRNPSIDIVVGARNGRDDGMVSRAMSQAFWWLFRSTIQPEIPRGGVDVFGCTKQVATVIIALPESNSSLIGQLYWVGFRRLEVQYQRRARVVGRSSWTLKRKLRYLTDSIFSFTTLPISLILSVGAIGTAAALTLGIVVLVGWMTGSIDAPGYTTLILVQILSSSALLGAVGVVGTYVWRTFDNTKNRPRAIIQDRIQK